jgi:uridine kinase
MVATTILRGLREEFRGKRVSILSDDSFNATEPASVDGAKTFRVYRRQAFNNEDRP